MAQGSANLTTWKAKRIIGDSSASTAANALLQTGTGIGDTWILNYTNRNTNYGIFYEYTGNDDNDQLKFIGDGNTNAIINLKTGAAKFGNYVNVYRETTATLNDKVQLRMQIKDTSIQTTDSPNGRTQTANVITAYHTHADNDIGMNIVMYSGGNMFFGAGEAPPNLYTLKYNAATNNVLTGENLFVVSDSAIYLEAGANENTTNNTTIADRVGLQIDSSGNIIPIKAEVKNDNVQNLGESDARFASIYGVDCNCKTITVGERESTTAPSVETYTNRITIIPYHHTGGPWYIKNSDTSSTSYLNVHYGSSELLSLSHSGILYMYGSLHQLMTTLTRGSTPSSNTYRTYEFRDSNLKRLGQLEYGYLTNGNSQLNLFVLTNTDTTTTDEYGGLSILKTTGVSGNYTATLNANTGLFTAAALTASGGLITCTNNSNTVTIGSQNSSFCHFNNSANIPFYFNKSIMMAQGMTIGGATSQYRPYQIYLGRNGTSDSKALNSANPLIEFANTDRSQYAQLVYTDYNNQGGSDSLTLVSNQNDCRFYAPKVHNAIWNDYAECRIADTIEPGYCVTEQTNGQMTKTTERLMPGCKLISDTYGTLMGETPQAQTPIAVAGRVLAYPYRAHEEYELGAAVCSAPGGTVDIMTREEIIQYPERIVGTVSEIPNYDVWYAGYEGKKEILVNGRIWIYVR